MAAAIVPTVTLYVLVVGLAIGSFVNLAADRIPRRESLLHPPSHCRACGRRLNMVDLVPVAGYVIRGGRCATCGMPIGISSPLVEATCGALMLAPFVLLSPWPGALVGVAATVAFGGAVTLASVLRGARSESRRDARSGPSRRVR